MVQLVFCLMMLVPLVALPVWVFLGSKPLGIVVGIIALVFAVPLVLAAFAHFDLLRSKSRYGLSDEELDEFTRLVPALASKPEFASLPSGQMKRSAKQAAAAAILDRRGSRDG